MVEWCRYNLSPVDPNFRFLHHDVYNPGLAPDNAKQLTAPSRSRTPRLAWYWPYPYSRTSTNDKPSITSGRSPG